MRKPLKWIDALQPLTLELSSKDYIRNSIPDWVLAFDFGEGGNVGEESQKEDGENGMKAVADALSGARIVDLL